jgi:hypothetical protein
MVTLPAKHDANFNANVSLAVLGILRGDIGGQCGMGKEKTPGGLPGAVSGAGELRRRGPWSP